MSEPGEKPMNQETRPSFWTKTRKTVARVIGVGLVAGASQIPDQGAFQNPVEVAAKPQNPNVRVVEAADLPARKLVLPIIIQRADVTGAQPTATPTPRPEDPTATPTRTPDASSPTSTRTAYPPPATNTPTPTETGAVQSEIAQWYLNAQEVSGTRLTKTVNGKECVLKSIVNPNSPHFFNWRPNFAQSVSNVTNFMCQDELGQGYEGEIGYDELAIAAFDSVSTMIAKGIKYSELGVGSGSGFQSWGYFGYISFEASGRKIRISAWAPPQSNPSSDYMTRASSNAALYLVHVSVAGMTDPRDVTASQMKRMELIQQDYVNMVKLYN